MVMQNSCRVFADLVVIFISKHLPSVFFYCNTKKVWKVYIKRKQHI